MLVLLFGRYMSDVPARGALEGKASVVAINKHTYYQKLKSLYLSPVAMFMFMGSVFSSYVLSSISGW